MTQETHEGDYGQEEAREDMRRFLALIDISHEMDPVGLAGELEELYLNFAEYCTDYETVDEREEEIIREQLYDLCVKRNRILEDSIKRGNGSANKPQVMCLKLPGIDTNDGFVVVNLTSLNGDIDQAQIALFTPDKAILNTEEFYELQTRFNEIHPHSSSN